MSHINLSVRYATANAPYGLGLKTITLCPDPGRERGSLALAVDGGTMRLTSITAPPIDNIPNWL